MAVRESGLSWLAWLWELLWKLASALVFAGIAMILYVVWPRDPIIKVEDIKIGGLKLRFKGKSGIPLAVIDLELRMFINCTNPNVVPIQYRPSAMSISYHGSNLGHAQVPRGGQPARSTRVLEVPAKMDGLEVTSHLKELAKDVKNRQMSMSADVVIEGVASVFWRWVHRYHVSVHSDVTVDPLLLEVIEQENHAHLHMDPLPSSQD